MPVYNVTETIEATTDEIWPILVDVLRWPEWTPTVSRVEALDHSAIETGARFRVYQPKLRPAVWTVTEITPSRSFMWESKSLGMRVIAEHRLAQDGPRTTRLELQLTYSGCVGLIVGILARKLTLSFMATEASMLKKTVEGSQDQ